LLSGKLRFMPPIELPRVLLLIPHLGGGGAERVTALVARGLSGQKYEVHLGLVTQSALAAAAAGLPLDSARVHALGARRVRAGAFRLVGLVRGLRPHIILSGMAHLNFLVLLLRPFFPRATRILVRQNSTASAALDFGGLPAYTRALYRRLYRRADRVICQSEAMARDLAAAFAIPESRLAVLHNPIDAAAICARVDGQAARLALSAWPASGPRLLAVGRLSREKGFDLLFDALAQVRSSHPNISLVVAGTGPEEAALKEQCRKLGLEDAVCFAGYIEDLSPYFASTSVFVLSSRYEGMPNALLEAAAAGLPIVALPSSEGVVELLRGRPGVWLAPAISAEALAQPLLAALGALHPGERFTHDFISPFLIGPAIAAYEWLIDAVLREARP
jgi:glycosyltransferase involved in cell wall biosynthesis